MGDRALASRLVPLAVLALVVVAGCTAPARSGSGATGDATPATTGGNSTPDRTIAVENGTFGFDANRTFDRVQTVLGSDVRRPDTVLLVDPPDRRTDASNGTNGSSLPPFWTAMGVDYRPTERNGSSGIPGNADGTTGRLGTVTLATGTNETTTRFVLAHEFVHFVQFSNGRRRQVAREVPLRTTDGTFVRHSLVEGVAVFATDAYVDRYLSTNRTNHEVYPKIRDRSRPGGLERYGNSWYIYGYRYVDGRIDDPRNADRIYEHPPTTSEQVIHGYAPGEEPPRNLSVNVSGAGDRFRHVGDDRMGEAFLRVALQNGLNRSAADRAAAGWGTDDLRIYRSDRRANFVWTLRFDDRANATEFDRLFREYLDARGNRSGDVWVVGNDTFDFRHVGPASGSDTVVVLIGSDRFVENAQVAGENGNVSVTLSGESRKIDR